MSPDPLDTRLATASEHLTRIGRAMATGGPWAPAARFDHAPEAAWGPREILAHLGEMLPYWLGEVERIIDGADGPAPFGRAATDDVRLAIIARDRTLPARELEARVQAAIGRWRARWEQLDHASRNRVGTHQTRGTVTVGEAAERFVVGHLEEHLDQLARAVGGDPAAG